MIEQGVRDFNDKIWFGASAPAATPTTIVSKLNQDLNDVLHMQDIKERFTALGLETEGGGSEKFTQLIQADIKRLRQLVKTANIKTD